MTEAITSLMLDVYAWIWGKKNKKAPGLFVINLNISF